MEIYIKTSQNYYAIPLDFITELFVNEIVYGHSVTLHFWKFTNSVNLQAELTSLHILKLEVQYIHWVGLGKIRIISQIQETV